MKTTNKVTREIFRREHALKTEEVTDRDFQISYGCQSGTPSSNQTRSRKTNVKTLRTPWYRIIQQTEL